jgi:hypothetical protein
MGEKKSGKKKEKTRSDKFDGSRATEGRKSDNKILLPFPGWVVGSSEGTNTAMLLWFTQGSNRSPWMDPEATT